MFYKKIIDKIKLLAKDEELKANKNWLNKTEEDLRHFMIANPGVRKSEENSRYRVERVNFNNNFAQKTRKISLLGIEFKPMTIIVSILIAAVLAGGGTVGVQAQDALPGEVLYPVKMATEQVRLTFSGKEGDVKLHIKFALRRAQELEGLTYEIKMPKPELIEITALRLKYEIELSEKGLQELEIKGQYNITLPQEIEEITTQQVEILEKVEVQIPQSVKSTVNEAKIAIEKINNTALKIMIGNIQSFSESNLLPNDSKTEKIIKVQLPIVIEKMENKIKKEQIEIKNIEQINNTVTPELKIEIEKIKIRLETTKSKLENIQQNKDIRSLQEIHAEIKEIEKQKAKTMTEIMTEIKISPQQIKMPVKILPDYCIKEGTNYKLSLAEAKQIFFQSGCAEKGNLINEKIICSEKAGIWELRLDIKNEVWSQLDIKKEAPDFEHNYNMREWQQLDIDDENWDRMWDKLDTKKEICDPVCFIDIATGQTKIMWRCMIGKFSSIPPFVQREIKPISSE